jgi:ribonuclease HI
VDLLQGINWIGELGIHNIIFQLDSKTVVDKFNKIQNNTLEFGSIFY